MTNYDSRNLQQIAIGLWMVLIGLILPRFIHAYDFGLISNINDSISNEDSGLLLFATTKLVLLNTIRSVPLYTGTFVMAEGLYSRFKSRLLGFIFPLIIIPTVYKFITLIYGISYDFGSPAYLTILAIIILQQATVKIRPILIKVVIIGLFLFGMQWLDVVPYLSVYGFGRGELSVTIKLIANFLNVSYLMNFIGLTFSIFIIINSLILSNVVIGYYHRLFLMEERRNQEERLRRVEVEAIKSRYLKEIKNIVHDLKTPLVTIQGLSGVIKLKVKDGKIIEYLERICNSAEKMSLMISEILYDNTMREILIEELFHFIDAQLSPEELGSKVQFDLSSDIKIFGNKIRISRAVINLIDNALKAIDPQTGLVLVKAWKENGVIFINIEDNGSGISKENLDYIWDVGYSTDTGHTGLGLNFVKRVVEEHNGQISIMSEVGKGTEAKISLPEVN